MIDADTKDLMPCGWREFRADERVGNARKAWEGYLANELYRLEFCSGTDAVRANMGRSANVGRFQIVDFATSGDARLVREPPTHLAAGDERFVFQFPYQGELSIAQFGTATTSRPGEFFLVDAREAYETARRADARFAGFAVTANALEERLVDPQALCGRAFSCASGTAKLARGLVSELVSDGGAMDADEFTSCAQAALDLLLAFAERESDREIVGASARLATRRRLHRFIRRHCADPSLTPSTLALRNGVSVRYLHELFEDTSETVGSLIRSERLVLARRLLADPRCTKRSVTEVALDSGFVNLSHFSTAFRSHFGVSPRDARGLWAAH